MTMTIYDPPTETEMELWNADDKIGSILNFRRRTGASLPDAKATFEREAMRRKIQAEQDSYEGWFNKVQDPDDWKALIDATLELNIMDVRTVKQAIAFYTATTPKHEILASLEPDAPHPKVRVRFTSEGYRQGPAGP